MAYTTLKQCADAFDEREDVLRILMCSNREYFAKYSSVDKKTNEIIFENQGLDMIEELASDKDKVKVTYADIASVLGVSVGDVAYVVKKNDGKVFSRLTTKAEDGDDAKTVIRCKEIDTLVARLLNGNLQSSSKPQPKVKKGAAKAAKPSSEVHNETKPSPKTTNSRKKKENVEGSAGKQENENLVKPRKMVEEQMSLPDITPTVDTPVKPKAARGKKKGKNAFTKTTLDSFGKTSSDSKSLRLFLLSSLNYKPEDVALMSDDEIIKAFSEQVLFETPQGTVVVERKFIEQNMDKFLFIPKEK